MALKITPSTSRRSTAAAEKYVAEAPLVRSSSLTPDVLRRMSNNELQSVARHSRLTVINPKRSFGDVVGAQQKLALLDQHSRFLLYPSDPFVKRWQAVTLALLLYTALATPLELAFLPARLDGLFAWNLFVDVAFLLDTVLNFFLTTADPSGHKLSHSHKSVSWIGCCHYIFMGTQ